MHEHHPEPLLPTPLAELQAPPLDEFPDCDEKILSADHGCRLLLLYTDRVEALNWSTGEKKTFLWTTADVASVVSRAPSGKIVPFRSGFLLLSNSLEKPLFLAADLSAAPRAVQETVEGLPLPEAGLNTFTLRNGKFWDFQFLSRTTLAVITTSGSIQLGSEGKLLKSDRTVGGTFWCDDRTFYCSSPSLPGQSDAIWKFQWNGDAISFESAKDADGEILDLAVTDLNQDQKKELLVTTRNDHGIFIEVQEPF